MRRLKNGQGVMKNVASENLQNFLISLPPLTLDLFFLKDAVLMRSGDRRKVALIGVTTRSGLRRLLRIFESLIDAAVEIGRSVEGVTEGIAQ
jgi:hypothetical protein